MGRQYTAQDLMPMMLADLYITTMENKLELVTLLLEMLIRFVDNLQNAKLFIELKTTYGDYPLWTNMVLENGRTNKFYE